MTVFRPGWPPIIPTPDRVFSGAIATKCNLMFCVPAFLEVTVATGFATHD